MAKYINIRFPFVDSKKGFFVDMTRTSDDAIKSDLIHLLLTNKGDRLYMPDFGTNLKRYIFEPLDSVTNSDIKSEIQTSIDKFIPNLKVNNITVTPDEELEYNVIVRIDYTVTNDVFESSDFVIIKL